MEPSMLTLEDVYGAEYLRGMRPGHTQVVIPNPSNAFNHDQHFEAIDASRMAF
jgi:hypothetical protein